MRSGLRPPGRLTVPTSLPSADEAPATHTASVGCRGCQAVPISSSTPRPRPLAAADDPTEDGGRPGVLSIGALYDEVEDGADLDFSPESPTVGARGDPELLGPVGAIGPLLPGPRRPRRAGADRRSTWPGRARPEGQVLEGLVAAHEGCPGQGRASPWPRAWSSSCGGRSTSTARRARSASSSPSSTSRRCWVGWPCSGRSSCERSRPRACSGEMPRLPVPEVPLRVGLVASPGTEGYRDFLGQLTGSGFGFHVQVAPVAVQGGDAPAAVARAIAALCRTDCDLVVVVRGGGSKADLATLRLRGGGPRHRRRAQAGLDGNRAYGRRVGGRHRGQSRLHHPDRMRASARPAGRPVVGAACRVRRPPCSSRRVPSLLAEAQARRRGRPRSAHPRRPQPTAGAPGAPARCAPSRLARLAPEGLSARQGALRTHAARLGPLAPGHVAREAERVRSWRRLLTAYDVERQLERGYTLTLTAVGRARAERRRTSPWAARS